MIDPFQDYDQAYADFRWNVPQHLNMAAQVCDVWCERDPHKIAIIDATDLGNIEHYTYATVARGGYAGASSERLRDRFRGSDRCAAQSGPVDRRRPYRDLEIGAISIPLFKLFGPEALSSRLLDAGAKCVIVDHEGHSGLTALNVTQVLPEALTLSDQPFTCANTSAETPAVLIYTSGTTGKSKGALHAHRVLMGHLPGVEVSHDFLGQNGDVIWTPADWAWIGGLFDVLMPLSLWACLWWRRDWRNSHLMRRKRLLKRWASKTSFSRRPRCA